MKAYTIDTGFFKLDGGAMFGIVPKSIWNKLNPADEKNLCTWAMRCLLIEDRNKLILIDCGLGNKQNEKFFSYYEPHGEATLEKSLKQKGFSPADVTDVVLTHLHFDHCGGAIKMEGNKYLPAFPNATYWSQSEHWLWATHPNDREKASFLRENILPFEQSGKLRFLKKDDTLFEGFDFQLSGGHTEAMLIPMIRIGSKTIAYMADLIPSSAHVPVPYVMGYDIRPLITMEEKKKFLTEAVQNNYYLFFEHDPAVECCTLQLTERGIRVDKTMRLQDIF